VDRIDATQAGRVGRVRQLRAPAFRACVPHRWDVVAQAWRPAPEPSADVPTPVSPIRVLTWNTLWDRYDADRIDTARRRPLLLDVLRHEDAEVIALQEVEEPLLERFSREDWVRAGFYLSTDPGKSAVGEDGLVLMSRLPVLESGRCELGPYKAALAITVVGPTGPLVIATTHLTSNHTADAAVRRTAELAELAGAFGRIDADLVVMGDFNDSTGAPAAALGLLDAWSVIHGEHDESPTFDPTVNPLAAVSSLSGKAGRLDRVLVRSRSGGVRAAGAVLVGDVPDETGLYPSDHFGIVAEIAEIAAHEAEPVAVFAQPTARTALAWIPPRELWPTINELRERYDPQSERWPPHVNVLFGFVPEYEFERAIPLIAEAAAQVAPFRVRLEGVETFGHRDDATIWLDPAAAGADESWTALHRAFQRSFPSMSGRDEGYTPHLTLGRSQDPQRVAAACAARLSPMTAKVGKLALLSRRGEEPMRVRAEIELGSGKVTWLPEAWPEKPSADDGDSAQRIVERIQAVLDDAVVHLVGSRRMGCALPGADVDLVADVPGRLDLSDIQHRLVGALPEAAHVRQVIGARVPGLRMTLSGLDVDLVVVPTGDPAYSEAAAIALSAVTDADAVLDLVRADHGTFARLARQVKTWAAARGLDSAPFGGVPGLAWSILAAKTVARGEPTLAAFFEQWAAWDWREPILTPTEPIRSCTAQVGTAMADLLVEELYRGWELTQDDQLLDRLCDAPPLHCRHAAWAVVTVQRTSEAALDDTLGRARGRMRALISQIEVAGPTADIHGWSKPLDADARQVRYVIGLGRTPLDRGQFAEIADRWAKGMPGVSVEWVEGGGVGSVTTVGVFER
jgi:endonuclease/exonuclease/phosphatase family metal-dependent hydrolase/2'-5' RNA ligase